MFEWKIYQFKGHKADQVSNFHIFIYRYWHHFINLYKYSNKSLYPSYNKALMDNIFQVNYKFYYHL